VEQSLSDEARLVELARSVMHENRLQQRCHAEQGREALRVLILCCLDGSAHSYRVRELLYGLWSGKPCSIGAVVALDWDLRMSMATVLLGWGYAGGDFEFGPWELRSELSVKGLWAWFLEEARLVHQYQAYMEAAR